MCERMMRYEGFVLLLLFSTIASAQLPYVKDHFPPSSVTYSAKQVDMNSFIGNPASLAGLRSSGISFFGERRYLLKELSGYTVASSLHSKMGNMGIGFHYTGFSLYNQFEMSFAYGRKLAEPLDIGLQFHFLMMNMQGYGKLMVPGFELGLMLHPAEKIHVGIKARDPVGQKFGKQRSEKLPAIYVFGIGYEPSSQFILSLEISRENGRGSEACARIQYKPHPSFRIRSGLNIISQSTWFSAGLIKKNMMIDISAGYHTQLGVSPGLQLSYNIPGKEK